MKNRKLKKLKKNIRIFIEKKSLFAVIMGVVKETERKTS